MKTKWLLVIGIVIAAVAVGVHLGLAGRGEVVPPIVPDNGENITSHEAPLGEPFSVEPGIVMDKALGPAYFEFGEVRPGALIDTWTKDGYVDFGSERIGYVAGEQMWILVYNGLDGPVTFALDVINAPSEINHSDVTGKDYQRAPQGFLGSVSVVRMVTVPSKSAVKVPLSIRYLGNISYPDQWEFRIMMSDQSVPGLVGAAVECRFFHYMRK